MVRLVMGLMVFPLALPFYVAIVFLLSFPNTINLLTSPPSEEYWKDIVLYITLEAGVTGVASTVSLDDVGFSSVILYSHLLFLRL